MELTVRDVVYVGSVLLGSGVTIGYIRAIIADLKEEVMLLRENVQYKDTCKAIEEGHEARIERLEGQHNGKR